MADHLARPSVVFRAGAWLRAHPYTVLATLCFIGYAIPFQLRKHSEWHEVYMAAGSRLLSGEHIYVPTGDYLGYVYPPFAALIAAPFTLLPHHAARTAWYLVNVFCLVQMLRWAWRLSGGGALEGTRTSPREHLICFLGLCCALSYAVNCFAHQQTDVVLGALMMGGCLALSRSRGFLAATVFGLAAAVKCTALLWCPYLLWRGRWKEAAWLACVAVGVNLLPNLLSAPEPGKLWLVDWTARYLAPMKGGNYYPGTWASAAIYNQSLAGAANRWALTDWQWSASESAIVDRPNPPNPRTLQFLVYGGELALAAGMLWVLGRRPMPLMCHDLPAVAPAGDGTVGGPDHNETSAERGGETAVEFGVVFLMMLLLSPMSNTQHFLTMILPAFCLARIAVQRGQRTPGILLLAAIAVRATVINGLWGERFSSTCLWLGSMTASAVFLLTGCAYVLVTNRRSASNASAPVRAIADNWSKAA
jgi:hypothetical protein